MNFNLQKLRYERLSRQIAMKDMGKAIGVGRTAYYKREKGDIKISVDEFSVFLDVLGISKSEAGIFFTHSVPERELISR